MSSVKHLREFISERLTAAAEEIFTEFEKTIVQYEEVIDRQRRLLDTSWKPQIKSNTTDVPQHHDCKEEEVLPDHQLFYQEIISSLDQEEPEPLQIDEDQEEVRREGEQLVLKDETDMVVQSRSESGEVYEVLANTSIQNEEETDHLPGLWNIVMKPEIRLHRIELSHQQICKNKEEDIGNQHQNTDMDQDEPEPPQIKEEQEQQSTNQEGVQLVLKQETETFIVTPNNEDGDHMEPEPNSNQLFFNNSLLAERHVQEANRDVFSASAINTEQEMDSTNRSHTNNVHNSHKPDVFCKDDTSKKSVKCDICGKGFKKACQMKRHRYVHTGVSPYVCQMCGKSYSQSSHLIAHMRTHTGEKPYSCDTCGKGFVSKSTLTIHKRIHTGEKPFACETCGIRFRLLNQLVVHMRSHTGEQPYNCKKCKKSFRDHYNLTVHMRSHTGVKPYCCHTCGKCFSQSNILIDHMRTHTGEKPFSCKVCGKSFNHRSTLSHHLRIHTGEKPYCCKVCGKGFRLKQAFNVHNQTHTGEKPYSCITCGKCFSQNYHLIVHMKTHTGEKLEKKKRLK
ncbi:zinc finger protein 2-like [Melanotaenia boesemani]|uniref:zinc finger protein 2-like n=1 Tax=Melanotaenia boesemani TaxID=1250792 RepID=UPI001C03CADD|nr:zinc finger protein 2-like [Melanotaenia boesemani]